MMNIFSPNVPVLLVGPPGVGKTASVESDFDYAEVVLTSTLVEEDIGGVPYRDGEYDYRTIPAMYRRLQEADKAGKTTVLFLDELDKARRSVADTLLTLIASRRVGAAVLPANTCIVAAANPPECGGGDGISEAMLSRFSAVEYMPDVGKWCAWARDTYKDPEAAIIIDAVAEERLKIFDMAGEGLKRRITCPRTLDRTLSAMKRYGAVSHEFTTLMAGLLTASSSSAIMNLIARTSNDVLDKSISLSTQSVERKPIKTKAFTPVRT